MIAIKPNTLYVRDQKTRKFVPLLAIRGEQGPPGSPGTIDKEETIISALKLLYGDGTLGLKYRLDGETYTVIGVEDEAANSEISVVIPPSIAGIPVTKIENFGRSDFITSVTISENIKVISNNAFQNCHKIIEVINKSSLNDIEKGKTTYGHVAYNALEVHGGNSKIKTLGDYHFYNYDGITYLVNYTGKDTEITLPEIYGGANYVIHQYVFSNKESLTSVKIPNGVTSIGKGAFTTCLKLKSLTIPKSLTRIGKSAFVECFSLTDIYYQGTEAEWNNIDIDEYNEDISTATIHFESPLPEV